MATIDQLRNWYTAQLSSLITAQGIHCEAQSVRGPFTLTYQIRITRDLARALPRLMKLESVLTQAVQTTVTLRETPAGLLAELELPAAGHLTPNAVKLAPYARWPSLPIGLNQYMQPVSVNLQQHGALYWIAPPRSGKSQSMMSTLYVAKRARPDLRFMVLAVPAKIDEDWGAWSMIDGCLGLVGDYGEMAAALAWAVDDMNSRRSPSPTVVIIDDLTVLAAHVDGLGAHVDDLAMNGPGLGYHLMVGTHGAGSRATQGGKNVGFAMTCRILFKSADNTQAARSAGRRNSETGIDRLSGAPGDGILDERGHITRIATARLRQADIMQLPHAGHHPPRPWRVTRHQPSPGHHQAGDRPVTSGANVLSPSLSPPSAHPHAAPYVAHVRGSHGDGDAVTGDDARRRAFLAQIPDCFPLDSARPLSDDEAHWLRFLHQSDGRLFNPTYLTKLAFGDKSAARLAHIRDALQRGAESDDEDMTDALAYAILDGPEDHPRRAEAFAWLAAHHSNRISIAGQQYNARGRQKEARHD